MKRSNRQDAKERRMAARIQGTPAAHVSLVCRVKPAEVREILKQHRAQVILPGVSMLYIRTFRTVKRIEGLTSIYLVNNTRRKH